MTKNLTFTYDIYIGAPAAKVWKGIVDPEMTRHYVYGTRLESKLKKGTLMSATATSRSSTAKSSRSSPRRGS